MSAADAALAPESIEKVLERGLGSAGPEEVARALALDMHAEDRVLCQGLVRAVAERAAKALDAGTESLSVGRLDTDPSLVSAPRTSFFMRMPVRTSAGELAVSRLEDVRSLRAVVRAGSLLQRRAAVLRVGELLHSSAAPMKPQWRKEALEMLADLRRFDVAYEVGRVRRSLPGSEGREARAEQRAFVELSTRVEAGIIEHWEHQENDDPLLTQSSEDRAQLFARARDLPDVIVRHVAAILESADALADRTPVRVLLAAIEHAGDPRLLPALRAVIEGRDPELFALAVRALSRIEDPRVHGVLREAFERAARAGERLTLAAALGSLGDARGLAGAREALVGGDSSLLSFSLEALAEMGGSDDVQRVLETLHHEDEEILRAAACALGRIGDGRALVPLADLRSRARASALRAEIEEANAAIRARMELAGEEPASGPSASATWDTTKMAALARSRDPASMRLRALRNMLIAYFWLAFGRRQRALARLEAAAALRPGWIEPLLVAARVHVRHDETAQALAKFRRAVEIDRSHVERHGYAITGMAQTFLRRAELLEREGRTEIARGLVEEITSFDLRRAKARVRLALHELREAHRTGGA